MQLETARLLAERLMQDHGLPDWHFKFDHAKSRMGRCYYPGKIISMSAALVALNTETDVRDVVLHEIAHALVGPSHHHDWIWRIKAREIGARPERCYHSAIIRPKAKHKATCEACGHTYERLRLTKKIRALGRCRCRRGNAILIWTTE